ncbi:response regulator [Ancylothrix sp. C2]|uniref:adenylate/guanylate cyclase domain-containing protein n=1 Tax=Ancylothrix sp. D3o TaxID=2953691 RepID=UPI0021BA624D|nr:adenylate/guanylate cyclase domain-containing protein [Ancylothrix sp. D3o]MCT7949881.1 response regulator [Ancylothrix sp. D3o]
MKKPVIICVDDEISLLKSLKLELKNAFYQDYAIEIAEGGEEALELIEELQEEGREIPLIISDYLMPNMKGDELLKRVQEISPHTLKVMLTGQANLEAIGNAINYAKLYRYIAKPWQSEDLILTVKEALNSYNQEQKLGQQNAQIVEFNNILQGLLSEQSILISKLHEEEQRLKKFLDAMPVGVLVTDTEGKPFYINSRAQELLGKGRVEIANLEALREAYQIYRAKTNQLYPLEEDAIFCALQGRSVYLDDWQIRQADKSIPIEVWGTPIYDEEGNIIYAIAAFTDITERKKAEAERSKWTKQLADLNCNLQKALETEFQLTEAASRFVPNQFLSFLGYESLVDVKLGDAVEQEMSILFCDIRDFTTISEKLSPQDNFKFINSYLSRMEPAIIENNGFIDKYIGDAIMALFGESADDAVKAGISMLQKLRQYNFNRCQGGYPAIKIGVGINTGSLMLGTVGGVNRMDSTVISDAVNLAARVETLTKHYGVSMLITQRTFSHLKTPENYAMRQVDEVQVKGKSESVLIYEVFEGDPPEEKEAKLKTLERFTEGLCLYSNQQFNKAAVLFAECLRLHPQDRLALIYLQLCQNQTKDNSLLYPF